MRSSIVALLFVIASSSTAFAAANPHFSPRRDIFQCVFSWRATDELTSGAGWAPWGSDVSGVSLRLPVC
jgi:hypothetical protein